MRYPLNRWVLQNFKAEITEKLVEEYINEISISQLKKEGFDFVFFNREIYNVDIGTILYVEPAHTYLKEIYNKLIKSSSKYKRPEYRSIEDWKKIRFGAVRIFLQYTRILSIKRCFSQY